MAVIKDGLDVPLVHPLPRSRHPSDAIEAIAPGKPAPNIWTVMQKWVNALPRTNVAEMKRNALLQKELERSVADLAGVPGLGDNGVGFHCCPEFWFCC